MENGTPSAPRTPTSVRSAKDIEIGDIDRFSTRSINPTHSVTFYVNSLRFVNPLRELISRASRTIFSLRSPSVAHTQGDCSAERSRNTVLTTRLASPFSINGMNKLRYRSNHAQKMRPRFPFTYPLDGTHTQFLECASAGNA